MEHFFDAVPEAAAVVWCDFILLRGYFVIRGRHFLTSCKNQAKGTFMESNWVRAAVDSKKGVLDERPNHVKQLHNEQRTK